MTTINVLVAINVGQALNGIAAGNANIGNYVYMVDSTGKSNSGQGGDELVTTVTVGDTLTWQVVSIDPSEQVIITGFTGAAIGTNAGNIVNPVQYPQYNPTGSVWGGYVTAPTSPQGSQSQYSLQLLLNGQSHGWFDPFIISNAPK
ncbi:AidA/PixA family protein [Paracidovorax valerianellae]|uniref:Inclusion body protein n=1 Tax=Paracidovorax valerianellae TaxID=187868 RepID=A0A1G6S258_9BURK|nr:AidA/PixA family protein [Paracidovorax valerianellae]MDA8444146.1 inclusion body family protein [Paracidovorax valerianellae]SDD10285.1 Inclusion body protein [Paracidovorax valerianellae]